MWHTSLQQSESSPYRNEQAADGERQGSSTSSSDSSLNNEFFSSLRFGPGIATPVVPQATARNFLVEMNPHYQYSRRRHRNRRHLRTLLPNRFSYYPAYCNHRSIEEANFGFREEPSMRDDFSNNRMSPIPEDDHLIDVTGDSISEEPAFEGTNSIRGFSAEIRFAPPPSTPEIDNNGPNLFESTSDYYMNHVAETLLDSENDCNDLDIEPQQSNDTTDPLLGNESIAPLLRMSGKLPSPTLNAQKLANILIKQSRYLRTPDLTDLHCLNCNRIPKLPVTGTCGHSRCLRCVKLLGDCPCGAMAPKKLTVNTVVRDITEKMTEHIKKPRISDHVNFASSACIRKPVIKKSSRNMVQRESHFRFPRTSPVGLNSVKSLTRPREPITFQNRQIKARELISKGNFLEAAPHLARIAASVPSFANLARKLLAQIITALCKDNEYRTISRALMQSIRDQSTRSWIKASDLECVICTSTLKSPVTTPCGHTYCRSCLDKCMCYMRKCALCLSSLLEFNVDDACDTLFVQSFLASIHEPQYKEEPNIIPIVTCYVAFPGMPCPLFIFDPKYWQMVRRVTESGSRKFGMLAYEEGNTYADYGTVLQICDCIVFEDNRCIISTVGVSRFRVIERFVKDGINMAVVRTLKDVFPTETETPEAQLLYGHILYRAINWLTKMDGSVQEEIETAFGPLPYYHTPKVWWEMDDGPKWLWWIIAILPLKPEIKVLMISTCNLLKRMMAVARTFDVMNVESDVPDNEDSISRSMRWALDTTI